MADQNVTILPSSVPSSSHRLPTVSASQALHHQGPRTIPTGIPQLDKLLAPHGLPGRAVSGGYLRGKVTEIFGPPGVGKTAFGVQAAVSALREGNQVVWFDAACAPLDPQRFIEVLQAQPTSVVSKPKAPSISLDELRSRFHHYTVPTLAHLLAVFVHPPASFPPPKTTLVVIDSLSTLFDDAYPRNANDRVSNNRNDQARWAAGRKFTIRNELILTLAKIAALHDIALLITSQTITRIRTGSRALLVPAISSAAWEDGVSTRLVLFRDWVPEQGKCGKVDGAKLQHVRFVGVLKANGVITADEGGVGDVVPFTVETGLYGMDIAADDIAPLTVSPQARPSKRRFAEIDDEATEDPDSDELYGWVEADEVAAEGLLIEKTSVPTEVDQVESGATRLAEYAEHASMSGHVTAGHREKVAQRTTM